MANGFDRTEETLLLPLDFKNIINMKCDVYVGMIILKYDTQLMTCDGEDALALFFTVVFCYLSICVAVVSASISYQQMDYLVVFCHRIMY